MKDSTFTTCNTFLIWPFSSNGSVTLLFAVNCSHHCAYVSSDVLDLFTSFIKRDMALCASSDSGGISPRHELAFTLTSNVQSLEGKMEKRYFTFCHNQLEGSLISHGKIHLLALRLFWASYLRNTRLGYPDGTGGKEPACQCRRPKDTGWIPASGRSPGEGHGNQFQYSCLENPMNRRTWWATVHRVTESDITEVI